MLRRDEKLIDRQDGESNDRIRGSMTTRRISSLLVAAFLLVGCQPTPSVPADAPPPQPRRAHNGYFIEMPREAVAPKPDSPDGAVLTIRSNLPSGTLAYLTLDMPGREGFVRRLHTFAGGALKVHQADYCVPDLDYDRSRGFNVQLIVVPDISLVWKGAGVSCRDLTDCGIGPLQPAAVQKVLGRRFERLTGDEVTSIIGIPALVAQAHYGWPTNTCSAPLDDVEGMPRTCPRSDASINEDEHGVNIRAVVNSISLLIYRRRICDLYNFLTDDLRRAEPWPLFRERLRRQVSRLAGKVLFGQIREKGPPRVGVISAPTFVQAVYKLPGHHRLIARFTASAGRGGETRWKIARMDFR